MNKFFLKLLCCVWVLLPPSPFSLLPSSSSSQQGVFSYVLWCRWFCRISHHCWLASHVILLLFFLSIVWVKFLGIVTISLTYSCSCTRYSLPHVPKYPVSWGTSTRGEYEQNFAISQSQNFLWVSVFKKKALIFDCSKILIFHTHPSPPAKIFVSLKCNAKIVKHALFSSHTLCVPLGANGSGHGSCCSWCAAAAVCLSRDQSPVLIPDLQHTTWCFVPPLLIFHRTIVYAVLLPVFVSSFLKSLYTQEDHLCRIIF